VPVLTATTDLDADVARALRVNLDLDVQVAAFRRHAVRPVAGPGLRSGGHVDSGERVRWSARLFGVVPVRHTSEVAVLEEGHDRARFVDTMVAGAFTAYRHEHTFSRLGPGRTRQVDEMSWTSPLGPLGRAADALVVRRVMAGLLRERNAEVVRRLAC
jgi:ligand-binding SRPBCC domain-containing protein